MHRVFLILLIALLPLRGWIGDTTAAQMASLAVAKVTFVLAEETGNATKIVAIHDHMAGTSDHFHAEIAMDCASHAASDGSPTSSKENCNTCGLCQVCNSVALAMPTPIAATATIALLVPPYSGTRFASADRALSLKPPTS